MRLTPPSNRSTPNQRREQSRRRRISAGALSAAFPGLELLRIHLRFEGSPDTAPSAQVHDLYPSAPAYFEFPCPCGDCDGILDLGNVVSSAVTAAAHQESGVIECVGTRPDRAGARKPCKLQVTYRIFSKYTQHPPGGGTGGQTDGH